MLENEFKIYKKLKHKIFHNEKKEFRRSSYSQNGEDLIIKFIFQALNINNPSYIDIGAHHPWNISNTALFYNSGSRGINIEPNPSLFLNFQKFRKDDINLNIGIGDQEMELDFHIISAPTLSTFSSKEAEKYLKEGNYYIKEVKKIRVRNFQDVIDEHNKGLFPHFLNIDAEGVDELIIKSLNFKENFPIVICIETLSFSTKGNGKKNKDIIDFIIEKGYLLYADTYINSIFVKEELWIKK